MRLMKISGPRADGTTRTTNPMQGLAEQKQQLAKVRSFTPMFFVIFVCMGLYHVYTGRAALERFRLLDTRGQTASGRVTDKSMSGGRHARYWLHYTFTDASGASRDGVSPVSSGVYDAMQTGAAINVTYLPDRKDVATLDPSMEKRDAQTDISGGWLLIGAGCVVTLFMTFVLYRLRKKVSQAAG